MDRYQAMFERLAEKQQGAFVPFVTVCDPNPEQSLRIMQTLVEAGADALELGIPFSDPLADGPTIKGEYPCIGLRRDTGHLLRTDCPNPRPVSTVADWPADVRQSGVLARD